MNTFKKILTLVLCLCIFFAIASCEALESIMDKINPKDPEDPITDVPLTPDEIIEAISKEEWNAALIEDKFNNVTFTIMVTMPGETEPYPLVCKLAGDKAAYSEGAYEEEEVDAETRDAIKAIYISTVLAMLENFENFTYDAENEVFVSPEDIVYNVTVMGYDAKITTSGTKVKFDTNKNIAEISCYMKQEFVEDGKPESLEFDAVFSFYNYGTTVVGSGSETPVGLEGAYAASCATKNVSMSVYAVETLSDGTQEIDELLYKTTATRLLMGDKIFSIENGSKYVYTNGSDGWTRNPVQTNAPIGTIVEEYVGMFESVFDLLTYNEETGVYGAYDFTINMYGMDMPFSKVEITVTDGKISKLEYIMLTYDYSGDTPTVQGEGHAILTFYDYGETMVDLPSEYTDVTADGNTPGVNAPEQPKKMSKEEWDAIFAQASKETNFTASQTATRSPYNGEERTDTSILQTTEFASHTTAPGRESEAYHSIEDGQCYYYYTSDGINWTKNYADPQNCPIGSPVIKQFTDLFCGLYDQLNYDPQGDYYYAENITILDSNREYLLPEFRIKFSNGKIVEIHYISYSYNGAGEITGTGTMHLEFYNYGTTVVELPTDYTDNTTTN